MDLIVNGKAVEFDGQTVSDLLTHLSVEIKGVAVEKNGTLVHREVFDSEKVSQGDIIEIVKFVGGG